MNKGLRMRMLNNKTSKNQYNGSEKGYMGYGRENINIGEYGRNYNGNNYDYGYENDRNYNRGGRNRYTDIYEEESRYGREKDNMNSRYKGKRENENRYINDMYESEESSMYRQEKNGMREGNNYPEMKHEEIKQFGEDETVIKEWVKSMKNADNSQSPHWTMEQTNQVMQQKGLNYPPAVFFAVMNMMYSDYCGVAKKHNISTADFYIDMAKAWLDDNDVKAGKDKTAKYYYYVVK